MQYRARIWEAHDIREGQLGTGNTLLQVQTSSSTWEGGCMSASQLF